MAKKNKPPRAIPTGEASELKHSPFAALDTRAVVVAPSASEPTPPQPAAAAPPRGRLLLRRETKHRGGKPVVVIGGFAALANFDARAIEALARECKQALACGGTVDGDEIVLQGDRPAEVAELLRAKGFRVAGVTT